MNHDHMDLYGGRRALPGSMRLVDTFRLGDAAQIPALRGKMDALEGMGLDTGDPERLTRMVAGFQELKDLFYDAL